MDKKYSIKYAINTGFFNPYIPILIQVPGPWQLVGILTNLGGCLKFKKFDVKCLKYSYLCVFYRSEQARERERERVITKKKTYIIEKYFRVASLSIHFIYI